jgi:hypothetical protein
MNMLGIVNNGMGSKALVIAVSCNAFLAANFEVPIDLPLESNTSMPSSNSFNLLII